MSVELLIAPPATGKTETCIQRIRTVLAGQPLAQVWVIVPDTLQVAAFRRRLAASGGAIGARVGRFEELYRHILESTGRYIPTASSPLLHRLVQEEVDEAVRIGQLVYYSTLQNAPGFILALRDSFSELKRALILPEKFLEFTQNRPPAERELAWLYSRYQARLNKLNLADQEGLSWLAVQALEKQPETVNPIRLLILDGFDSFTGAQRQALQHLAGQVENLLITFPGEIDSGRPAHRRFMPVIETLRKELSPNILSLSGAAVLPTDIQYLEKNIFEPGTIAPEKALNTTMLEARAPADEAREALRWIKARVVRDGVRLTDCVVFTPDPDIYNPLLRSAAAEFGVPVVFFQANPLRESPVVSALLALLNLPLQNFKSRALFNCLRSPYFDFSLTIQAVDALENISQAARIVEGLDQWAETWDRLAPKLSAQVYADIEEESSLQNGALAGETEVLKTVLERFFERITPPAELLPQKDWINWLENLLEDSHFFENASSSADEQACEALLEALKAILLSETVVGPSLVDYSQFLSSLEGTLDGIGMREAFLRGDPSLLIGRLADARGVRYKAVALLGLSEGLLPIVEKPDPFLSEELRETLGLETRLEREQAGLFYQALLRSDKSLLVTRPYLSEDGENWEPSPFWKAMQDLFGTNTHTRIRPDDLRPLPEAASSQELLFWAVRDKSLPSRFEELRPRWEALRHARDILKSRRAKTARGIYEGAADAISRLLNERYSPAMVWSASRLESYGTCPQMFYIGSALDLIAKKPPELGLDANQLGSMLHKILEDSYRTAANPADLESVLGQLQVVARQVFMDAPQQFGFRPSALWVAEQEQFLSALETTITGLAQEDEQWTPFAFEQKYGMEGSPMLELNVEGETIRLHGVIDRLDRNMNGDLRVIDYKTGGSHMSQADLKDGRRLQLPIYALAARDALRLGEPGDGFYWKILAAQASPLKLKNFKTNNGQGPEAAYKVVRKHLLRIVLGIRAGKFQPKAPHGGCPAYCPAAQWCWRYTPSW